MLHKTAVQNLIKLLCSHVSESKIGYFFIVTLLLLNDNAGGDTRCTNLSNRRSPY